MQIKTHAVALLVAVFLTCGVFAERNQQSYMGVDTDSAIEKANKAVAEIVAIPNAQRTFDNTIGAIDDLLAQLELDANMTMFLAYVSTDAEERARGEATEKRVTDWLIELGKNEDLYNAVQAYAQTNPQLVGEQKRLLEFVQRDYRRAGMTLSPEKREELKRVQQEINTLGIEFEKRIREDDTALYVTRDELSGMPDDYFNSLSTSVGDTYIVGLSYPEFIPVMDFCDNELTRKKFWLAYKRRGGEKNVATLEKIIELRAKAASLLGYENVADYETEVRMAKNSDNVVRFYEKVRPLVRQKAMMDWEEFLSAKRSHTGDPNADFYPWDYSYYKNYLLNKKYKVDAQKVQEYFPLDRVTDGLFSITQSLYGLEYTNITDRAASMGVELWHEDAELYEVTDNRSGEVIGMFAVDLHPRPNKYGHAAQWGMAQHKIWTDGSVTKPLAILVCNFTKPTADKPALMTHDEVETYFHEFGHCLHTLLSEATYWRFSGTNVERDFVEAPSQMFENWVWNADVLKTFARHYKSNEVFPKELLDGMVKARYLGSGMEAERQFYYGNVDLAYHLDGDGIVDTTQLGLELQDECELYDSVPGTYFQAAFGHLVGYQAGYYGYQWSLVYAADMFQRFKELGMLNPEAGMYYREKILSVGGTKDGLDMVTEYLGREPKMDAYLKHLGLSEVSK